MPAFIAALLAEGVDARQIEQAVFRVRDLKLGESYCSNNALWRAFANEQDELLRRAAQ
jgi:hypothetical protein